MAILLDFSPEIEAELRARAEARGVTLETWVRTIVDEQLKNDESPLRRGQRLSSEEFERRLQAFIDVHPVVDHFVDCSRESIYEGRGE